MPTAWLAVVDVVPWFLRVLLTVTVPLIGRLAAVVLIPVVTRSIPLTDAFTVTLVKALLLAPALSVAVSLKLNAVFVVNAGAIKLAVAALALLRVAVGPTVCVQA